MRKLLLIILLSSFFLGGYYLGHQPGSPNIFTWAKKAYAWSTTALNGEKPSPAMIKRDDNNPKKDAGGGISIKIDGKVYTLSQ